MSLRSDVFERRTSTGSALFAILGRDFEQMVGHIGSIRVKTVLTTNLVQSGQIKREKGSLPADVRTATAAKTSSYRCFVKQSGHDNYRHDHTRRICLIFYQLLPTTSAGNEYGQQMRIQILILGLKGLNRTHSGAHSHGAI